MGLTRDMTHANGSCSQPEPRLISPVAAGPKAILDPSGARTQLEWVLLGRTQLNIFFLGVTEQPDSNLDIFKNKIKKNTKTLKILIWSKENNKKISNFFQNIFETQNQTYFNKEI